MLARTLESVIAREACNGACNEDTKSEPSDTSDTEHQASGASSSAMDKKTSLDKEELVEYYGAEVGKNYGVRLKRTARTALLLSMQNTIGYLNGSA